ncbi:MAG: hypothetical protein OXG35_17385, partial [Acidobacteria bacterium]|nr:hypothetical protein [Acidobacteriota bacterium]
MVEILTEDGVRALTGHEGKLPGGDIRVAHQIDGIGKTYHVEDVLQHWPGELPDRDEIDRRLGSLRRGIDRGGKNPPPIGANAFLSFLYCIWLTLLPR